MSYPQNIAIAVDCMVFRQVGDQYELLLIQRKHEPFKGQRAFPGGFLDSDETLDSAANRELFEETGVEGIDLMQLYTFSGVERDPRGRVVTTVYFALLQDTDKIKIKA